MKVIECRTTHLMNQSLKLNDTSTKATSGTTVLSRKVDWDDWDNWDDD